MLYRENDKIHVILKVTKMVALCGLLTACASTGNQKMAELNKSQLDNITSNQVKTKEDALSILGEPDDIDFNSAGNEKWTYKYLHRTSKVQNFIPVVNLFASETDDLHKKIVFVFDKNGVVLNSAATEAKGKTKGRVFPRTNTTEF